MKILHVITDLKIGGESRLLVRALSSLSAYDHVVACLAVTTDPKGAPGNVRAEIEELGVPVVDLGVTRNKPLSVAEAFFRLSHLVRRETPNVIHSTLIHANLLSQPLTWSGYPLISSHVGTKPWRRDWQRIVERYTGQRTIFLANAQAVADTLVAGGLDRGRIRVLYYGVDCDHFRPDGRRADVGGEEILLGVGRLRSHKGFEDLIEAVAVVPARPDVLLIGDGPSRQKLERRARDLGVKLTIVSAVRDIAPYLRRASAVVLPSLHEGLPNVLLEALATECSVVATDLPGHLEVIRDGENGILVAPSHVPALAQGIERALSDDGSLGAEGRRTMLARFRWDHYIQQRRVLYEAVATRPSWPQSGCTLAQNVRRAH